MALLTINQNPTTTDTILFDLYALDVNGNPINPYKIDQVTIYFVERDYSSSNLQEYDLSVQGFTTTFTYKDAVPVKVYGTPDFPAWLSSDTANAFLTQVTFDSLGNPEAGHFQLEWTPSAESQSSREGDYFLCYTWTPIPAGDSISKLFHFYLSGTFTSPAIPSHRTNPKKYPTMLERYTPDMFKQFLVQSDVSPIVIQKTNLAVADGFTQLENLANQLVDLLDANVTQEAFLPYLANMFRWKLRSNDPTLWRRQVKQAIPLYKKKGTLGGLKEALNQCGIEFKKITYYWQVVSKATWQEAFVYSSTPTWCLSKNPILPTDFDASSNTYGTNYHVWLRAVGTTTWVEQPLNVIVFTASTSPDGCGEYSIKQTCFTYNGSLNLGDEVRVLYKIAEPADQTIESYIQTLPLADQRDELTVTFPAKNWNERLIAEDDYLFPMVVPQKHPFVYPVVYGKIRTEFPYSEQIYNMDEYNGSVRDSNDPCDLDYTFYDTCSACRSSKISIDILIEELSTDRITETEEIIKDFLPFHAVLHSINYVGLQDEIIPPPLEELECLIQYNLTDTIALSQFDFDRIILDGKSDVNVIKRDMLADADVVATGNDGVGSNIAYSLFSPGIDFSQIGVSDNNLLEILSGTNTGSYTLAANSSDVIGITQFPLDQSGFPFRFSNIQYEEMGSSVYQDNVSTFNDPNVDFSLFPIPDNDVWVIKVTSGSQMGNYTINKVNSDNTLVLSNWTGSTVSNFNYQLNAPGGINVMNGISGAVVVVSRGRLQTQLIDPNSIQKGDYVLVGGSQYPLMYIGARAAGATFDKIYIDGYTGGNQVGSVNIKVLRRLIDTVGYLNFRGMNLHTTINYETSLGLQNGQNPTGTVLENSDFKENYLILIGTNYYQMADINGHNITLSGPILNWGSSTVVSYTIIQFVKHPVTIQSGYDAEFRTFDPLVDRRGDGSTFVLEQNITPMSMTFRMQMLNKFNDGEVIEESVKTQEKIWYTVVLQE